MSCCVPFCKSRREKKFPNIKISFHEFPVDEVLYRQWLRRIARKDFIPNDKSNSSVVCSKHFTPEDFVPHSKVSRLKKNAVPTVFPMYPPYALLPPPNNSSSLSSSNHFKKPFIRKNGSKNSRKEVDPAIVYNFEITSISNKFSNPPNKNQYGSSHLLQTLNHLKKLSTKNSKTKDAKGIAFNSETTSTNNLSSKQPSGVHSFANFNNINILFEEKNKTENLKEKDATGIVFYSDMISTSNNSLEEPSEVGIFMINEEAKDSPDSRAKRQAVSVSNTVNLTEKAGTGIAINCNMISTNKNSLKQPSVVRVLTINESKKDPPATNNTHSLASLTHPNKSSVSVSGIEKDDTGNTFNSDSTNTEHKNVNRVLTLNDLIHKKVTEKSSEIRNLKSLLWKKNQKLKKMKEEISNLEEKVSIYETNDHHEILRKISALKENSSQSHFFMDQMDNFFKKRPTWRESTIRECASWIAFSPKSYDFVRERKLMVLPCRTTLLKYAYSGEIKRQKIDTFHLGSCQAQSPGKLVTENSALEH